MDILTNKFVYAPNISWCLLGEEVFVFDERDESIYVLRDDKMKLWISIGLKNSGKILKPEETNLLKKWVMKKMLAESENEK